jgi:PAS domain S-box-containing protein
VKGFHFRNDKLPVFFPDIKEYAFDYIGTYGRIALEGGEIKFEEYFEATRQYLSIYAYSPLPGEFTAIFTDVTERRRAEEWLLESQMRMATFSAATFEGIIESEAGSIVDCNNQIARMLGYQEGELKGMQIAARVAPEDLERVMANIRQGRESVVEHALLAKDGSRIVAEAHGRSLSPGSPTRLTAIRNITGRKEMESALQTTLQRFYDVLSSMYCGILLVTDEARVEFANQAFCECFALEDAPGDLVGLDPRKIIEKIRGAYLHPDEAVARIRETLELGRPGKGSRRVGAAGGRTDRATGCGPANRPGRDQRTYPGGGSPARKGADAHPAKPPGCHGRDDRQHRAPVAGRPCIRPPAWPRDSATGNSRC